MVTFDAGEAGTPAATWRAHPRYPAIDELHLDDAARLVVIAAHPDDESLGAGGLIARAAASGGSVHVIFVTDGSASHPESGAASADVARIRREEAMTAVGVLARGARISFLDVPDSRTPEFRTEIATALTDLIDERESPTLIAAPFRADGHRDHRVVGELAADLARYTGARLVEYPIWMWHWGSPESPNTPWSSMRSLSLTEGERALKHGAIAAHRSQVAGLSDEPGGGPMLRGDFLEHFETDTEVFIVGRGSLGRDYFDDLYRRRADPWSFETRWYEKRKRALTLAVLPDERFASVLEIGCSIGLLTTELVDRSDRLLAVDVSTAAVEAARDRVGARHGVTIEQRDAVQQYPPGDFDLIVLSEVGYYLGTDALVDLIAHIDSSLSEGGCLVACHWRHPVTDYPLSGDQVHELIADRLGLTLLVDHREEDFLLQVFSRDGRSVATREGLA